MIKLFNLSFKNFYFLLKVGIIFLLFFWGSRGYAWSSILEPSLEDNNDISDEALSIIDVSGLSQEKILAKLHGKAKVGVQLWSLKNGRELFASNSSHTFVPASNIKLFTAVASLLSLGSHYTFDTSILTSAKMDPQPYAHVLKGNLYFKFSGDPSLTKKDLHYLVMSLRNQGIEKIDGNIYIDSSDFNGSHLGPGWAAKDIRHCYAAPVSAVIIDHNCLSVLQTLKETHVHQCLPFSHQLKRTKHHKKSCRKSRSYYFSQVQIDPNEHARRLITKLFSTLNIAYSGNILPGNTPKNATILAIHQSPPLNELLRTMLKESDNLFADAIFKKIGAQYFHQPGNWDNASQAVKKILASHTHINFDDLELQDGSGISSENLATPRHFTELLNFAYRELPNGRDFISALPISGRDGTLVNRMRSPQIVGRVHAKTGTMYHVAALSGYVETHHKDILIFSIIVNGFVGSFRDYRNVVDELLMESVKKY